MLSSANRVSDDREHRAFVHVENSAPVSSIRIDATGPMLIDQVAVEFWANGRLQTQVLRQKATLDARNPSYTMNLGSSVRVNRVVVYGRNGSSTSGFTVMGL
jgi:hypothetical protein